MADYDKEKNKGMIPPPPPSPFSGQSRLKAPAGLPPLATPKTTKTQEKKEEGGGVIDEARRKLETLLKQKTLEQQSKWKEVADTLYEENKTLKDKMTTQELELKVDGDKKEMMFKMYMEDMDRKIKLLEQQLLMEKKRVEEQAQKLQEDKQNSLKLETGLKEVLEKSNKEKDIKKLKDEKDRLSSELEDYRKKVDMMVSEMNAVQQKQEENNIRWGEEFNEKNAEIIAIKAQLKSRQEDLEKLRQNNKAELTAKEQEIDRIMEKFQSQFEMEKKRFEEEMEKREKSRDSLISSFTAQNQELEKNLKHSDEKRILAEAFQAHNAEQKQAMDKLFAQISGDLKKREEENNALRNQMNNEIINLKNEFHSREQVLVREKMDLEFRVKLFEKEIEAKQKQYDDAVRLNQAEYEKKEKELQYEINRLKEKLEEEKTLNKQQAIITEKQLASMQEKLDKGTLEHEFARAKLIDVKKELIEASEQLQRQVREKETIKNQMNQKLSELEIEYSRKEKDIIAIKTVMENELAGLQRHLSEQNESWERRLRAIEEERSKLTDSLTEAGNQLRKKDREFLSAKSELEGIIEKLQVESGRNRKELEDKISRIEAEKKSLDRKLQEEENVYEERVRAEEIKHRAIFDSTRQREEELQARIRNLEERIREQSIGFNKEKSLLEEKLSRSEEERISAEQLIHSAREKIKAKERDVNHFEQELKKLETSIDEERTEWKDRIETAIKEKDTLKHEMNRMESEFRSEKDKMLRSIEDAQQKLKKNANDLWSAEALKQENIRIKDELTSQKKKVQVLIKAVNSEEAASGIEMLQNHEAELRSRIEEKEKDKLEADRTIENINSQLAKIRAQLKEQEDKNNSMLDEMTQREELIESLRKNSSSSFGDREKIEEELRQYREAFEKKDEEFKATKVKMELQFNILKNQRKQEDNSRVEVEKEVERIKGEWESRLKDTEEQLLTAKEENKKLLEEVALKEQEIKEQIKRSVDGINGIQNQLSEKGTATDVQKIQEEYKQKEEKLRTAKLKLEKELEEQSSQAEGLFMKLQQSLKEREEEIKALRSRIEQENNVQKKEPVKVKNEILTAAEPEAVIIPKQEPVETTKEEKVKLKLEPRKIKLELPKTVQAKPITAVPVKPKIEDKPKEAKSAVEQKNKVVGKADIKSVETKKEKKVSMENPAKKFWSWLNEPSRK